MVLLARLTKQVMRRSSAEMLGMDLRLLMALSYLADHDGAPQHELVDALCMDAKNVVLLLNDLEDNGYLVRRRDSEDRRRHRVQITTAGREALERAADSGGPTTDHQDVGRHSTTLTGRVRNRIPDPWRRVNRTYRRAAAFAS